MDYILFSEYAFGRFTPTLLLGIIAVFFIIQVYRRPKNKPAVFLCLYFIFLFIFNFGYLFSWSLYAPSGFYGWYLAALAPLGLVFLMQFAYHFPVHTLKKESIIALIIFTVLAIFSFADYVYQAAQNPIALTETGWGSTYGSQFIPVTIILSYFWVIIIFCRQSLRLSITEGGSQGIFRNLSYLIKPEGREARAARQYCIIVFLELLNTISVALFMYFDTFSYVTINNSMNTAFLVIAFLYVVIYINNSPESMTFMVKLIGISLVTILMLLSFSGYISLFHFEDDYNRDRFSDTKRLVELIESGNFSKVPDNVSYIINSDNNTFSLEYKRVDNFNLPKKIRFWEKVPSIRQLLNMKTPGADLRDKDGTVKQKRFFSQFGGKNYYNFPFETAGSVYVAGFDYINYRENIHELVKDSILMIIVSAFAIMFIFPFLFYSGLVKPLNTLLSGVNKADKGDLCVSVPIQFRDEIGHLTGSFNTMIQSIKTNRDKLKEYADHLEDMVEDRTMEIIGANEELEAMNDSLIHTNRALEEAHRIANMDIRMASQVQASLFPESSPDSKHWDIAFEFKPMSGVSGDFYDFFDEKGNVTGVGLFDVSGHGVASGLITMIARSIIFRYFTRMGNAGLGNVLQTINKNLIKEISDVDNYLTGILLRFEENKVEYVNAAHPAIVVKRSKEGKTGEVIAKSDNFGAGLLGIEDMNNNYTSISFPIEQGDVILLYTDCLNESKNEAGELYGKARIKNSLKKAESSKADDILNTVLDDFYGFIGDEKLRDDLTVLVITKK